MVGVVASVIGLTVLYVIFSSVAFLFTTKGNLVEYFQPIDLSICETNITVTSEEHYLIKIQPD